MRVSGLGICNCQNCYNLPREQFTRNGKYFGSQRSQKACTLTMANALLASRAMTVQVFAFFLTSVLNDLDMHHDS